MEYVVPLSDAGPGDSYVDAVPATGVKGSAVPAAAIEYPMREIVAVISAAGLTPDDADLTQLLQAIQALIAAASSMPTGTVVKTLGTSALTGTVKLNGALLDRTTYADLWTFAQASGNLVTDANWSGSSLHGSFSDGDGATTFRLPDARGYFFRAFDDGRGLDVGRVMGAYQPDLMRDHKHGFVSPRVGTPGSTGQMSDIAEVQAKTELSSGETRPMNIPALFCIKY